ncbi:MAG TPA: hypothetical protein VMW16_02110 [Sedimentisphaerales bacterium]|nr:hypothetical protein [Sedimentisphaerales bacterium]
MSRALQKYLDHVMAYANRKQEDAIKIRTELEDHLMQKIADLEAQGLPREDAIFQAIEDHGTARTVGYGLRKGFALLDVRTEGTARGFVAIGPRAIGVIAFGGVAVGLFAFGGFAIGAIAFGWLAVAALISCGGISLAPMGAALGLAVLGRIAIGMVAGGGLAVGLWVPWAVDRVSLLGGDDGLQFLQHFRTFQSSVAVVVIISWLFIISPFLTGVMGAIESSEHQRIEKADPKLAQ